MKSTAPIRTILLLGLICGGCMVGPDYKPPHAATPPAWSGLSNAPAAGASAATPAPAELAGWWKKFNDPMLVSLVTEAFRTNLDLQLAEAQLRQARANRGVVGGPFWPGLTANGSYARGATGTAPSRNLFTAGGLDAAWELDFFGATRRNIESADAGILAARENVHDVQVTLAAEIALNYIQLRAAQEQIDIARENLKSEEATAVLTRKRLAAGFVSALDEANAEAQVATTAATIPVLETTVRQSIYSLSVLLARPPADLVEQLSRPGPVPLTPPEVPVGLPSDLLRRRPDIREAEAQLHAAMAQIGVAKAAYFPQFSLTGSVDYQSDMLRTLFAGPSRFWTAGPSVTWPIFQGGALTAKVRVQQALSDQAYITYQKTVLTALQDVENQLVAFAKEWDHRKALNEAVVQNRKAVDLSTQLYTEGTSDFLSVLDAERSLYASENALSQSKASISTDLVALYKALGGGWE
ncbi:MAG: efflux transporter outer membrane subunit [Verrucomicrobiota bacterium]|jgi:NodT family efflux transporter outer membrane factor (OMF) lipoprotein